MALAVETVAVKYVDVGVGAHIPVHMTVFEPTDIQVTYGKQALKALIHFDYEVHIQEDFSLFTLVPLQSLIDKIDALILQDPTETNYIIVRRVLDYETEVTAEVVSYTPFVAREFDRIAMRFQQIADQLRRIVQLDETYAPPYPALTITSFEEGKSLIWGPNGTILNGEIDLASEVAETKLARDEAVSAQATTEAARNESVSARTGAETARDQAVLAETGAFNSVTQATSARDAAINAQNAAQTFRNEAQTAKTQAIDAAAVSTAGFDPSALPDADLNGTQRLIVRNGAGDAVEVGDLRIDIRGGTEGDTLVRSSSGKYVSQPSGISGEVKALAHNTVPQGWLLCDGAEVSRTTYSKLYSLIGDQYGAGDGTATFNVPDLRGEFLRGWDNGRGIDAGRVLGSSQDFATARDAITFSNLSVNQDGSPTVHTILPSVAAGDNETRPRNVSVNYIIKT